MSFWRVMAVPGGDSKGQAMNVANSLPIILSPAAAGRRPRQHIVTVRSSNTGPTADVISLSVLRRIGMTRVQGDDVNGCAN
jgi:hypothetical protein